MRVGIIGTGYVGLVTGVTLASIGHDVICMDKDRHKVEQLKKGILTFYEKDLESLISKNQKRLYFTSDYKELLRETSILFICVSTPEKEDLSVNLGYVYDACNSLLSNACQNSVIIIKSTVPIGTNDKIEEFLNSNSKYTFKVVSNPEFLSQGTAVHDSLYPTRLIIGTCDKHAENLMRKLYKPLTVPPYNAPILIVSRETAELIKYASNSFLAMKISYINEVANLCNKIGVNIDDVVMGMGFDNRIGKNYLKAGIGYGGSCLPKDTNALYKFSLEKGSEIKMLKACIDVNQKQNLILFEEVKYTFDNDLKDKNIAILGLSFKAETDDIRNSPAIININNLLSLGTMVKAYDPEAINNFKKVINKNLLVSDNIAFYDSIDDTVKDCDAVLIFTDWNEIKEYDVNKFKFLMKQVRIYDGRNCIDVDRFNSLEDIQYFSIGKESFNNINSNN